MKEIELENAHGHSLRNRMEIERSSQCGCFSCKRTFLSSEVEDFIDDGETALCPYCCVDAVIGDASGFQPSEDFLRKMQERWM